ncbi:hypothetical protein ACFL3X_00930 [Gemmatimonadota bacterium]
MNRLIGELQTYLSDVSQLPVGIHEAPEIRNTLPLFLGQQYHFYRCMFFNKPRVLLVWKGQDELATQNIVRHLQVAQSTIGQDVVFVFPDMVTWQRQRLVQNQIPFIVPRRQVYLPEAIIDFRSRAQAPGFSDKGTITSISAPAQLMVLYYLQCNPGEHWYLDQWAQNLDYSAMTISRAYRELIHLNLCEAEQWRRRVILHFDQNKHSLWKRARKHLQSPVRKRMTVQMDNIAELPLYCAGLHALSRYSQISMDRNQEYASASSDIQEGIRNGLIMERHFTDSALCTLESWLYAPKILAYNDQCVDRLSLFLSLQHDQDERIQMALKEMLEGMAW